MLTVALLVFPGVQALDVFGPTDVFSEANRLLAPEAQYQLELIATERDTVRCSSGVRIGADRHFEEARGHYDLLLVAGGPSLVE